MFFHVTPEGIERANKIKQALGTALPAGFDKAAKEMTPQEARDALVYLNVNWELHMKELSISDDMKVISPKAEASTRVTLEPNIISGISFLLDSGKDFPLKPVTLAFGVALWRLASELKKDWGVTTIYSGGIGIGRDDKPGDCHNSGRCIDFFGADTSKGNFRVERDWGNQLFVRPDKVHARTWVGYKGHQFSYRLENLVHPPGNTDARDFFRWVYEFAQRECRDIKPGPSDIGGGSFIIHPDHPDPIREHHRNHIHFQLGAT